MARTGLMRLLHQLASEHNEASDRNVPVTKVRDERRAARDAVSRRDLLKGIGAAAAAAAVTARGSSARATPAPGGAPRIAIVGGGIAGLNAALTLHDAGYASTVYEASSDVGGRMHSDTTNFANGQTTEWCGELIDTAHNTIQGLVHRFGLSLTDLRSAQPNASEDTYWFLGNYYPASQVDSDFQPVHSTLRGQVQAAGYPTLYNASTPTGQQLDNMSIYDWIEAYVPGGHTSRLGLLLDVAYVIEYGRDSREQSSLNLVYLLGYNSSPGNFQIFGASDERYHIAGGNQQLPRAIAASLPAGSVVTRWRLASIASNADGTSTLVFSTPTRNQTVVADRVILALPFSVLRTLDYAHANFETGKRNAIANLGYGTNSKLQLQFDTRLWNEPGPWGVSTGTSYADTGYQNTWDVTRGQPGATGILVDYTGGSASAAYAPDSPYTTNASSRTRAYASTFLHQLEQVFPGISARYTGSATLSCPALDPNLRGSYSCWLLGQYTTVAGWEKKQQGTVHFAGEHCSIDFQGFMEGGAQEGARAANEIVAAYR